MAHGLGRIGTDVRESRSGTPNFLEVLFGSSARPDTPLFASRIAQARAGKRMTCSLMGLLDATSLVKSMSNRFRPRRSSSAVTTRLHEFLLRIDSSING